MGEHEVAATQSSPKILAWKRIFWLVIGPAALLGGIATASLVIPGARHLQELVSDEGTESFSVKHGFFGILGCVAFLGAIAFLGVVLAAYGIHCIRQGVKNSRSRG